MRGWRVAKSAGHLGSGRRALDEVPPVPDSAELSALQGAAQSVLAGLVHDAGGRYDVSTPIALGDDDVDVLADLFEEWGRRHAHVRQEGCTSTGGPASGTPSMSCAPSRTRTGGTGCASRSSWSWRDEGGNEQLPPRGAGFYLPS